MKSVYAMVDKRQERTTREATLQSAGAIHPEEESWLYQGNFLAVSKNSRFANYSVKVHASNNVSTNSTIVA